MADIELTPDGWAERAAELREEGWTLIDLCGVDRMHLGFEDRFGIVVQLLNGREKKRRTVHVAAQGDPPTIPSVCSVWSGANFMEREAYDMFGIHFEGHPRLTRILMPDEWEGFPLRKDYAVGKLPVDFVQQPLLQIDAPGQSPSPGGAEVAADLLGQTAGSAAAGRRRARLEDEEDQGEAG